MIGQMLGHYQVLDKLGAGGMGEVYLARDTRLNRDVAIKVLPAIFAQDRERMARFEREAQLLAQLNHPNIAAIYGLEESGGQRFLVLEYVPGETLAQLASAGPIAPEEAIPMARQIAEALEDAHETGIMHRDLKPANVKITPEGKVKVLDFGLAKALSDEVPSEVSGHSPTLSALALTRGGVLLGTAAYMSPEQARGRKLDKRSDIWAFGCVLYELLTARQTFNGETITDILAAIVKNEPEWGALPEATPPRIRALLRRCLEKDPKRRLRDIGEARLIVDAPEPEPAAAPAPVAAAPAPKPQRALVWIAAVAVLGVALVALAVMHFREKPPEAPATRFLIPAPEKANFTSGFAISPDGRRVVFGALGADGRNQLWLRPLESLDARAMAGTDTPWLPFWSHDSRFIGFTSGSKLRKIEASGGPPQTLCDVNQFAFGGSWNQEGVVIFGGFPGGVSRVSAAGGAATPVTTVDPSRQEGGHMFPQFLPDGRHFLYLAVSTQLENSAIYATSLDAPKERKRLVAASHSPAYAPPLGDGPGHLLFLREGTLMAQPFDAKRLELAGDAFPIAEQVGSFRATAYFSVSTNGVLAYRTGAGGQGSQLAWFDRAGKQLQTVGPPGDYNDLALSPDDTRVAVNRRDPQSANRDLWLIEIARNMGSRFTFHPAVDWTPVWSPDGGRIVFASPREGPESLYQKVSSGAGNEELLLKTGSRIYANDWSRDGRHFLYSAVDAKTRHDLWVLPLDGDRKPKLYLHTEFEETQGQFSPDGKFVAYSSNESGTYEVYVQPFPASGGKWMISSGGGVQPRWRRDGKEIFYIDTGRRLMAAEVKTSPQFQAAVPKPLFDTRIPPGGTYVFRYAAGASGQRFLMNTTAEETASAPMTVVLNWMSGVKR